MADTVHDTSRDVRRPSLEALVAAYDRDGFVNGGRVLDDRQLAQLSEDLESFADSGFRGKPAAAPTPQTSDLGHDRETRHYRIVGAWKHSAHFHALIHNRAMLEIAAALARTDLLQLWADTVQYKPPHEGGPVNWHQDGAYHVGVRPSDRIFAAWIALDDADEESGCMWMAPGSHKWGDLDDHLKKFKHAPGMGAVPSVVPPEHVPPDAWRGIAPCPVRAGEVHFHHAYAWHASPVNRSARRRRGTPSFSCRTGFASPRPIMAGSICPRARS